MNPVHEMLGDVVACYDLIGYVVSALEATLPLLFCDLPII